MYGLLIALHVLFCIFLILVILLQTGKGGGMGAAFGGGSSQTVFGPRGAGSFIGKLTGAVAALFMVTSLILAYLSSSGSTGVIDKASALNEERAGMIKEVDLQSELQAKAADTAKPAPVDTANKVGDTADASVPNDAGTAQKSDAGNLNPVESENKQVADMDTESAGDRATDNGR